MKLFMKLLVFLAFVGGFCLGFWKGRKDNSYTEYPTNGRAWIDTVNVTPATSDSFAISKRAVKLGQPVVSMRADTRLTKTDTTFWLSKKPISLGKPHKAKKISFAGGISLNTKLFNIGRSYIYSSRLEFCKMNNLEPQWIIRYKDSNVATRCSTCAVWTIESSDKLLSEAWLFYDSVKEQWYGSHVFGSAYPQSDSILGKPFSFWEETRHPLAWIDLCDTVLMPIDYVRFTSKDTAYFVNGKQTTKQEYYTKHKK